MADSALTWSFSGQQNQAESQRACLLVEDVSSNIYIHIEYMYNVISESDTTNMKNRSGKD